MKKMKIMLLSFALLAIVGGALAFKAKGHIAYCTADPESGNACIVSGQTANKACPNRIILTNQVGGTQTRFTYCYTTPVAGRSDCKDASGADLLCTTPTTSFKTLDGN